MLSPDIQLYHIHCRFPHQRSRKQVINPMLSLGWSEITIIIVIVVLVVGPKELPSLIKNLGMFSKKMKTISREFNTYLNNISKEVEIDKIKDDINKILPKNIKEEILNKTDTHSEFKDINSSFGKLKDDIKDIKNKTKDNLDSNQDSNLDS